MQIKKIFLLAFVSCISMPFFAYCESFLKAASFPATFDDLSFESRNAVKSEGYEPFAELSAYDILTILETDAGIEDEITANEANNTVSQQTPNSETTNTNAQQTPSPIQSVVAHGGYCTIKNNEIPANQKNPIGKPVFESDYKFCSRYGYRKIYGKNDPHYGFDIGCTEANFRNPVFAIADGVVEKVQHCSKGSSAGNYILINHQNGFKTYYMHLDEIFVQSGQPVSAGCQIAALGYTGGAKANKDSYANEMCPKMRKSISHLHYEIHYSGNQTSVSENGKTIQIRHGFPGHKSVDPSYFMGVPQHAQ